MFSVKVCLVGTLAFSAEPVCSAFSFPSGVYIRRNVAEHYSTPRMTFSSCDPFQGKIQKIIGQVFNDDLADRMPFGVPEDNLIRVRDSYILSYDPEKKNANWVYEILEGNKHKGKASRKKSRFTEDSSISKEFRACLKDFKNSSFDRGHLAAAANHRDCQKSMDETFILSNISPQVGIGFNRGIWSVLEVYFRDMLKHNPEVKRLHVFTGPLYLPQVDEQGRKFVRYQVIGKNNVAVSTHFFKVVLAEKEKVDGFEEYAFVIPNEKTDEKDLRKFVTTVEKVQKAVGIKFFNKISKKAGQA